MYIECMDIKKALLQISVALAAALAVACGCGGSKSGGNDGEGTSFTDPRDNQRYRTVKIGGATWMAENLGFDFEVGSKCYDYADSNCAKYGRLYTWHAAMVACPAGWGLPDNADWEALVNAAGGGLLAAKRLKSKTGWGSGSDSSGSGGDDYGFSALPGGSNSYAERFHNAGISGKWWSATTGGREYAYTWAISSDTAPVSSAPVSTAIGQSPPDLSVRCVWVGHNTGAGDREYRAVTIGKHTWMAENLNIETRGSSCYEDADVSCAKYGRLYTWYAAMKACPSGWHLPNRAEWEDLMVAAGGAKSKMRVPLRVQRYGEVDIYRGAGKRLKSKSGWADADGIGGSGTDDHGFSALPAGTRFSRFYHLDTAYYGGAGSRSSFWSAEADRDFYWFGGKAFLWKMSHYDGSVTKLADYAANSSSVRCSARA